MNTRTLGTIAMVLSPALLLEALLTPTSDNTLIVGLMSFLFMMGWLCTNIAMQQMEALGSGRWAKIVLRIQMVG